MNKMINNLNSNVYHYINHCNKLFDYITFYSYYFN